MVRKERRGETRCSYAETLAIGLKADGWPPYLSPDAIGDCATGESSVQKEIYGDAAWCAEVFQARADFGRVLL